MVTQYKNFQVEVSPSGFRLYGTETFRPTLRELLDHLAGQNLRADNIEFQLIRCCPPQPRGEGFRIDRPVNSSKRPAAQGNIEVSLCSQWAQLHISSEEGRSMQGSKNTLSLISE